MFNCGRLLFLDGSWVWVFDCRRLLLFDGGRFFRLALFYRCDGPQLVFASALPNLNMGGILERNIQIFSAGQRAQTNRCLVLLDSPQLAWGFYFVPLMGPRTVDDPAIDDVQRLFALNIEDAIGAAVCRLDKLPSLSWVLPLYLHDNQIVLTGSQQSAVPSCDVVFLRFEHLHFDLSFPKGANRIEIPPVRSLFSKPFRSFFGECNQAHPYAIYYSTC